MLTDLAEEGRFNCSNNQSEDRSAVRRGFVTSCEGRAPGWLECDVSERVQGRRTVSWRRTAAKMELPPVEASKTVTGKIN